MQNVTQANYFCIEGEAVLAAWHLKAASAPEGGKRLLTTLALGLGYYMRNISQANYFSFQSWSGE